MKHRFCTLGIFFSLFLLVGYSRNIDSIEKEQLQQKLELSQKYQNQLSQEIFLLKTKLQAKESIMKNEAFLLDSIQKKSSEKNITSKEHPDQSVSILHVIKGLLVLVILFFIFKGSYWGYKWLCRKYEKLQTSKFKSIIVSNYEVFNPKQEVKTLKFFTNLFRWLINIISLLVSIPILFLIFPQTKNVAYKLFGYITKPIKNIFEAIVEYIPNIFTITIIYIVVHYLVKLARYLSNEIATGRLRIKGFYPDWAKSTYTILKYLLYAFMITIIYPYLPGSNSGIFKGVSIFIGVLISLGSTSFVGNLIGGIVITYMRSLEVGDMISLNNIKGEVVERSALVIRIRTYKNELITIPNSSIMTSNSTNLSQSAKQYGLIIHSQVSIGYDVPWRTVHQLLINAALQTEGIQKQPEPFVLETSLSDNYPVYQINGFISDVSKMPRIYSDLLQQIQDVFAKADVEILSPSYFAMEDRGKNSNKKENTPSPS